MGRNVSVRKRLSFDPLIHFRKILFWAHLVAGIISGLAIGIMCFTGVALAFEKQLVAWTEREVRTVAAPAPGQARLSIDDLVKRVEVHSPDTRLSAITISADPRAAVVFSLGRDQNVFADPNTGEVRAPTPSRIRAFLHTMEEWHRFLALSGDQRPLGKLINGTCNIAFFALAVTGLYLWMPRRWSWRGVRAVALFNSRLSGKARDFNWHNVVGLWSAPILIVLTLCAVPISFRWGNALVYQLVGETPPAQPGPGASNSPALSIVPPAPFAERLSRDLQFAAVQKAVPDWETITLRQAAPNRPRATGTTPSSAGGTGSPSVAAADSNRPDPQRSGATPTTFMVKTPRAWPRTATTTLSVNPYSGDILQTESFSSLSAGRRLRSWTRFLHTGEALGITGQLVAGAACLGGCFLVYTGFALACRRFFGKRTSTVDV